MIINIFRHKLADLFLYSHFYKDKIPTLEVKKLSCLFSTTSKNKMVKFKNNSVQFSDVEQTKILEALNKEPDEFFKRLNIPPLQINKLNVWKSKKGKLNSIDDVLNIEGIDVKNLIKICQSIILEKPVTSNRKLSSMKNRQLSSPILTNGIIESLTSTVGLHLGPAGISWAHISCPKKKLNYWGSKPFSDLPMKVTSWENFNLAIEVLDEIPSADLYVFETPPGLGLSSQNQLGSVAAYTQQIELTSMLFALLNTSKRHNIKMTNKNSQIENVVFYMRAKLAARLFKTWVGTESVSTITTVKQLFKYNEFDLPCSAIDIDHTFMENFESQPSFNKELMGQSLLLTSAFLDVCVYKRPESLKALSLFNKSK